MPILVLAVLLPIFYALYYAAWLVTAGVLLYVAPAALVLVPAAMLAGALLAVVVIVATLLGVRSLRPATVTPAQVEGGTPLLPGLPEDAPFPRDRAWPSYLSAQRRVDLGTAWSNVTGTLMAGWHWIWRVGGNRRLTVLRFVLRFVLLSVLALGWAAVSVGALAAAAVLLAACGLVLLVEWGGWIAIVGLLRTVDLLVRRRRRADASCHFCYHVAPRPCYACDNCGKVHRDVRPGRLGAVWRRCGCGAVLPTMVLRAARVLGPRCAACGRPLRDQAGAFTDVRIPVFGPVSAGKTRLVHAGLLALRDAAAAAGGSLDFVDDDSRAVFDDGAHRIASGGHTVKTARGLHPAITARLELPRRRRGLVHLFDAAGESYADREDSAELAFLDHAQGLVFVVDPFSIRSVRDRLAGAGWPNLARVKPAWQEPEAAYQTTSRQLRDHHGDLGGRWLAVAVVKADLLAGLPPSAGLRPGRVRQWLVEAGLDNLVLSAERDFGKVGYFLVASTTETRSGAAASPANPFDWLLSHCGLGMRSVAPRSAGGNRTIDAEEQPHEPANA
jgi:hypothetical protein